MSIFRSIIFLLFTTVSIVSGVDPPENTGCKNEKVLRGKNSCIELSANLGYYVLWDKMDPAAVPADFKFTLVFKTTSELVNNSWLGFGIALNGGMKGLDVVMIIKDADGTYTISDRYADDYAEPYEDKLQNYELVSATTTGDNVAVFEIKRPVDSCDVFDIPLKPAEVNFCLWSTGTWYNGSPTMHAPNKRGAVMCDFFDRSAALKHTPVANPATYEAVVHDGKVLSTPAQVKTEHLIKEVSVENQYVSAYIKVADLFTDFDPADENELDKTKPVRMIYRIDPVIDNEAVLHHMLLLSCKGMNPANMPATRYDSTMPPDCNDLIYAWAVGATSTEFPGDVALPIGDREQVIAVNMHYYNPTLKEGQVDASGFRLYALPKNQTTQYTIDVWLLGDIFNLGLQKSMYNRNSRLAHYCPADCMEDLLEANELNVFSLGYHAHFESTRASSGLMQRQFGVSNTTDFEKSLIEGPNTLMYDYNHQRSVGVENMKIKKGQHGVYVRCEWNFGSRPYMMNWGDGSNDEMCFALIQYYPQQPALEIGNCAYKVSGVKWADNLYSKDWMPRYRTDSATICNAHCDYDSANGIYNKRSGSDLYKAQYDLFQSQGGVYKAVVRYPDAPNRDSWRLGMVKSCSTCNPTGFSSKVVRAMKCETCKKLGITSDCAKLEYLGYCPKAVLVGTTDYIADPTARGAAIDDFTELYVLDRENRMCDHYCGVGLNNLEIGYCRSSGKLTHFPTIEGKTAFPMAAPTCLKAPASISTDECTQHSECPDHEYCVDAHNVAFAEYTPAAQTRNFCYSCSRCCSNVDGIGSECPSKCNCSTTHQTCARKNKIYCSADGFETTDQAKGIVPPGTIGSVSQKSLSSQCSTMDVPANDAASVDCNVACPNYHAGLHVSYEVHSKSCSICVDHEDVYVQRMEGLAGDIGSFASILKPFSCAKAKSSLNLLNALLSRREDAGSLLLKQTATMHSQALCRYHYRERCVIITAPAGAPASTSAPTSTDNTSSLAPRLLEGYSIGMIAMVMYLTF